jgi:RsiW-degrading membrane proteinase PrsW (M82 family)
VALVPLGIVIPTFLWLDRFESEPTRYLVSAFLWGALVAAVIAAVLNTSAIAVLQEVSDPDAALATTAVLVAPLVEEAAKGAFVLLVWLLLRREFDGITDGMVYAGICAAGFAFTENIHYLAQAWADGGGEALTGTFVARCLLSPFAHPMFTILTGVGIGVAATSRTRMPRVVAPLVGFLLAVLAHALWNLGAVAGGEGLLTVYLLVEVPVFLAFLVFVAWARRREGRLIGQYLHPYVDAGWLSSAELAMLASMPHRREARAWARANTGRAGLASMRAFQDTASELALLRVRMSHSAADDEAVAQERELLLALGARRAEFIGMPVT